ncbi:MAG: transketolase [Spirochaetales bacterium]
MNETHEIKELERKAVQIRKNILRMIKAYGKGHLGGALSAADILTVLYFKILRVNPEEPKWVDRDRFVLSAGHKCLVLYAALAERGFFPKDLLDTYGTLDSKFPGHPDMHKLPGVETNTGALGHGLSIAGGMALGAKLDHKDIKVYVVMGDGELAEGSNWEAAASCAKYRLDNLLVFVDKNGLQISGPTKDVMDYDPLVEKWKAFGWAVREINGHSIPEILQTTRDFPFEKDKPSVVIAHTVKSKGISFAEGKVSFHYWNVKPEEMAQAEAELEELERRLR